MNQREAAFHGDLARLQQLVTKSNVDETFARGETFLHYACQEGHAHIVEWLIGVGAKLNVRESDGWTPLHYAAFRSFPRCTQILLDAGADPSIADDDGNTPLHLSHSVKCATLLISAYPDGVYLTDNDGNSPLHRAAEHGRVGVCLLLLKAGCAVDTTCSAGFTPLYWALCDNYRHVAELLIEYGAQLARVKLDHYYTPAFPAIPGWAISYVARRQACRSSSYAILELARRGSPLIGGNRRDALGLVARCVWNTRQDESWNE